MIDRRQLLVKAFKLFDLFIMIFCFAFASWISFLHQNGLRSFEQFLAIRIKIQNFVLFIALILLWHAILSFFSLYQSWRLSSRWREVFNVIKATILGSILVYVAAILFRIDLVNLSFIAIFWIANVILMFASRLALRWGLGWVRRQGRNLRCMLIAGTNNRAIDFARKIESRPELGYRISGFVDWLWEGASDFLKSGYKIVTDLDGFSAYLREHVVDEVVISLPLKSQYRTASRIAALSEEQGIVVRYLPDIFDLKSSHMKTVSLEGLPLVSNYTGAMEGWQIEVKRLLDILISGITLVIFLPLLLITAIAIKLTSSGPVFFVQERIGINKRRFHVYKFRTMVPDAEKEQTEMESLNEVSGPVFKIKKDPRITSIGKILRKLSIDELPQLFNVLKGDMSLVGPRPLPIRDYNGFSEDWHRRRFSVRPGITCLWQVNGRSSLPFERWMELDMEYIDKWSLWLDFRILAKTFPTVLRGSGAA
jgi:exopolysaccharide biosynthesis polyprenyl glycosylphosphotransferase